MMDAATSREVDFIRVVDGALSKEACTRLISMFDASPHRVAGRTASGVELSKKDSTDLTISRRPEWQDAMRTLARAVEPEILAYARCFPSLLTGAITPTIRVPGGGTVEITVERSRQLDSQTLGSLVRGMFCPGETNIQKYASGRGGYPLWHSEVFPQPRGTTALRRVLFWICYLNDVETGGETEFLHQSRLVRPVAGRLLLAPTTFTHTHRGRVPTSGDKYIATSWLLYRDGKDLFRLP